MPQSSDSLGYRLAEVRRLIQPPKYPVVLCHGLMGFDRIGVKGFLEVGYFRGVQRDLEAAGCNVCITTVPKSADVSDRAASLADQVNALGSPVNLIGHSMGGLDGRYFICQLGGSSVVKSLTTIGTPHRGTYFADWGLLNVGERMKANVLLEALGVSTAAFRNLTRSYMRETFNPSNPDREEVAYFSVAGAKPKLRTLPALWLSHELIERVEGPNDGLVSVESARWGEFLGTVPADHAEQVNWGIGFNALPLYRFICQNLAEKGF